MRFVRFNGVGAIGFGVQLATLAALLRAGVPYLLATAVAVEASIVNNFVWHERWTWRDRPATGGARLARLRRFHLLNGVVSLGGNLLIVAMLLDRAGWTPLAANVVAVASCGVLNYFGADRVVFETARRDATGRSESTAGRGPWPCVQRRGADLQVCPIRSAERNASATKVSVAFVQPPVGSVGDPATKRFS